MREEKRRERRREDEEKERREKDKEKDGERESKRERRKRRTTKERKRVREKEEGTREEEKERTEPLPRADFQHASVCVFKTLPCVPVKRAHVEHMRAFCRHRRKRFEPTHGDVLNLHMGVFRVPSRATHTTPHTHRHNPTHNPTHTTQHKTTTPKHKTYIPTHTRKRAEPQHGGVSAHQAVPHTQPHTRTPPTQHTTPLAHTHHTYYTTHTTPAHRGQPTMILHSIKIWNICNVCNFLCGFIVFGINSIRNIRNLMRIYCFGINLVFVTNYFRPDGTFKENCSCTAISIVISTHGNGAVALI